jgi:monoamine oxidase
MAKAVALGPFAGAAPSLRSYLIATAEASTSSAILFCQGHVRVRRLADEFGLHLRPAAFKGNPIALWRLDGKQRVGRRPPLSPRELLRAVRILHRLKRLASDVPPTAPWSAPCANHLDSVSFADWAALAGARGPVLELLRFAIGGFATVPVEELSTLQVAWWVSRAGGVLAALRAGLEWEIAEGTQALAAGLANDLRGPIILDSPTAQINQDKSGVEVIDENGTYWQARVRSYALRFPALLVFGSTPP